MDESFSGFLRWFLLGIGVVIIAGVYWFSRRTTERTDTRERVPPGFPHDAAGTRTAAPTARPEAAGQPTGASAGERVEPHIPPADHAEVADEAAGQPVGVSVGGRVESYIPPVARLNDEASLSGAQARGTHSKVLVLHVQSKSQRQFAGADILRIAERAGLERATGSDGGFFQYRVSRIVPEPDEPPLFYMANMFSPGVFDWGKMEDFSTAGLSLFAQLPGTLPPLETFDELLKCARLFAAGLGGAVRDDSRSDLTVQTIQHIKEELQAYALGRAAPGAGK